MNRFELWDKVARNSVSSRLWSGWVTWPVQIVPDMAYNVFGGTLNHTLLYFICYNIFVIGY